MMTPVFRPLTPLTWLCMAIVLAGCTTRHAAPPTPVTTPSLRPQAHTTKPTVAIITTGGTIAMRPDANASGAVPALTGEALVAAVPELRELAFLRVISVCNIDSRNMSPDLWLKLARVVQNALRDPQVTGAVITHGTDTMEETAFFLDRTLNSNKPVVLTGAQRDASAHDADGPRNLLYAVRQVLAPGARGRGVTVTLNGRILAARPVTKVHTSNVDAFAAGPYGLVGQIDSQAVTWFNHPQRTQPFVLPPNLPKVDLVMCYPGADGRLIDAAMQHGAAGIVVAGYGTGTVNQTVFDAIRRARNRVGGGLAAPASHTTGHAEHASGGSQDTLQSTMLGGQGHETPPA